MRGSAVPQQPGSLVCTNAPSVRAILRLWGSPQDYLHASPLRPAPFRNMSVFRKGLERGWNRRSKWQERTGLDPLFPPGCHRKCPPAPPRAAWCPRDPAPLPPGLPEQHPNLSLPEFGRGALRHTHQSEACQLVVQPLPPPTPAP